MSVAVTMTTHGFAAQVMDSKSWPEADTNLRVPEFTSNNVASVPDRVYAGSAVESVSLTVRATTSCVFSCMTAVESEVNTGAVSSASVMVTVNVVSAVEPSALVAVTATVHDVEVSWSSTDESDTVTAPEEASIAKAPEQDCAVIA